MMDHSRMKLGKLPARHDPRTLLFANYLRPEALPPAKPRVNWASKIKSWPMMKNDTVGDCTCASAGHIIQEWTTNASKEVILTDDQILAAYSAITGYDPRKPQTDRGAQLIDVLNYWRKTGIGKHKVQAYVALEPGNLEHVKDCIDLFGGSYIGLALPVSAQRQAVWSVPPGGATGSGAPGSWGGHAVPIVAYDERGLTCVTWGALKRMTWTFWQAYCDEAYAVLSPDWMTPKQVSPEGFDLEALKADLTEVTG